MNGFVREIILHDGSFLLDAEHMKQANRAFVNVGACKGEQRHPCGSKIQRITRPGGMHTNRADATTGKHFFCFETRFKFITLGV